VQDKKIQNADLKTIYPVVGGSADSIKSLKMQRLNVGFSRTKDTMVFVHSMPLNDYKDTRLGDALAYYHKLYEEAKDNDFAVDEAVFDSPMEKWLYSLLTQTKFVAKHHKSIKITPQFNIGEYLRAEFRACLPKYRADFLLTYSKGGKEQTLIIEYDGLEWHTKNPEIVTKHNFTQEYLEYDKNRQLELESYGYRFLRINKFTLKPESKDQSELDVLNNLLENNFNTK
jgi:very-short-patch-repair endonuclease